MINQQDAEKATRDDDQLLLTAHPFLYRLLKGVAKKGPAVHIPRVGTVISDASLMRTILLDGEHFTKNGPGASSDLWTPIIGKNGLINMDGDEHKHLRRVLQPIFIQKFAQEIVETKVSESLQELRKQLSNGESIDIVKQAEKISAEVICALIGVKGHLSDEKILDHIKNARELTRLVTLFRKELTPKQNEEAKKRLDFLNQSTIISYRDETENTVPFLLKEQGLNEADTLSVISALIITGTETVVSTLPRLVKLFIDSGFIKDLVKDRNLLNDGLNEGLRVIVPTPVMLRSVQKATSLNGILFKKHNRVILSTVMACKSPGAFNPYREIPKDMRQIWFGAGVHFCIGMPLATEQFKSFINMLLDVAEDKDLHVEDFSIKKKTLVGSYERLVISCR